MIWRKIANCILSQNNLLRKENKRKYNTYQRFVTIKKYDWLTSQINISLSPVENGCEKKCHVTMQFFFTGVPTVTKKVKGRSRINNLSKSLIQKHLLVRIFFQPNLNWHQLILVPLTSFTSCKLKKNLFEQQRTVSKILKKTYKGIEFKSLIIMIYLLIMFIYLQLIVLDLRPDF